MRTIVSAERVYLATLALSGCGTLVSVTLPAAQRGVLAASIASATMGSAIGGLSIDTFLLSRPRGWVVERGLAWVLALALACLLLSAAVAALLTTVAGVGAQAATAAGAGLLTVVNAASALALRRKRFLFVYLTRGVSAAGLIGGYGWLIAAHESRGGTWFGVWVAAQVLAAGAIGAGLLRFGRGFRSRAGDIAPDRVGPAPGVGARRDIRDMGTLHAGVCAQMMTYRLDQILLARIAGPAALGVYALAVAATEFAQAGAVVGAQRILADDSGGAQPAVRPVIRRALPVAVAAVAGLAVLGRLLPDYRDAWLVGLVLLPGCLAVSVGKTYSAALLKRRGEWATTAVAVTTLAVAVPAYAILVPPLGMYGAALASSVAYLVYALRSRMRLRGRPAPVPHGGDACGAAPGDVPHGGDACEAAPGDVHQGVA